MQLSGKRVLVLGLGESGLAIAKWCARMGARLRVADTRETPPGFDGLRAIGEAKFCCGPFDDRLLDGIDVVALSPGLSVALPIVRTAQARKLPVVGEIELFVQGLRQLGWREGCRIIAITGTNGKTTTTSLTGHLCRGAGLDAAVAGNISPAALDALMARVDATQPPQVWVLELSSFQLETTHTLDADAATVLNITEDHLDRHRDMEDYANAKARIFVAGEKNAGVQVLNRDDARVARMALPERRRITFGLDAPTTENDFGLREHLGEPWLFQGKTPLLAQRELPIAGRHNAANAMAALALCNAIGLESRDLLPALRSFRGLRHRVEKVASANGIDWYDDSKGTNVGATVAALAGIGRPVVLILGGDGKGQDFSPLRSAVEQHARAVVLIGRDADLIAQAIGGETGVPLHAVQDMGDAVAIAARAARAGDAVLLSPACASFDMFRNYEHRAQVFIDAVHARLGMT